MKIVFQKILKGGDFPLKLESENYKVDTLFKILPKNSQMVFCSLSILGELEASCNRCGEVFIKTINENIEFYLYNGIFNGFDDKFDVVEVFDNLVDLEEIVLSELELISSDYLNCESCKNIENFEF